MTLQDWLKVYVSDAIARAKDSSGRHVARRVIENTVRDIADGAIDELAERFPILFSTELSNVNEQELCDSLAAALTADTNDPVGFAAGAPVAGLGDVFQRLRGLNVPWLKILALVGPIIQILTSGGTFQEIMAKIIALFFPPAPGAAAMTAAKA